MKQGTDIQDASDIRNAIDTHREALIAQRDEINDRLDRLDRAMAVIDGEDLVTRPSSKARTTKLLPPPTARGSGPRAPQGDNRAIVLGHLVALGALALGRWVACLAIVAASRLRAPQVRGALLGLQKYGHAEPNGVKASGSRWRATKAGIKATTKPTTKPKQADHGTRQGTPPRTLPAEPRPGSQRAKVLAGIRATGADGMTRKAVQSLFGLDAANQSAMVQGLLCRGFIRIEGPRGEQRVIATSLASAVPVSAPASVPPSAPPPEPEAEEVDEQVEQFRALDAEEPASNTTAGQMLAKLRKAGAKGMLRTTLETSLEINTQRAATMVRMLDLKGLVRVEGEKADQRVFALRARPVEAAPEEDAPPAYTSPEQPTPAPEPPPAPAPAPEREPVPAYLARKPIPVPRNPPPLVYPGAPGSKTAPPPAEPPPPATKAAPLAQRRVIKLELIREREDRFFCKPLTGSMDAGTCIDRQEIANSSPTGATSQAQEQRKLKSKYMPTCASCKDGKKVVARVQEFS